MRLRVGEREFLSRFVPISTSPVGRPTMHLRKAGAGRPVLLWLCLCYDCRNCYMFRVQMLSLVKSAARACAVPRFGRQITPDINALNIPSGKFYVFVSGSQTVLHQLMMVRCHIKGKRVARTEQQARFDELIMPHVALDVRITGPRLTRNDHMRGGIQNFFAGVQFWMAGTRQPRPYHRLLLHRCILKRHTFDWLKKNRRSVLTDRWR